MVARAGFLLLLPGLKQRIALAHLAGCDTRQDDTIPIKVHHGAAAAGVDRDIAEIIRCHFEVELVRTG
jgi:hypothetical protein